MNSSSETIKLPKPLRDVRPMDASLRASWQTGYDQGRIDGEKALGEQLIKQRGELQEIVQGTLNSLRQTVSQVARDTENTMVSLALEVARKLVSDMPVSVPMIEAAVHDALTHVESSTQVTVRLHPADLDLMQNAGSTLLTPGETPNQFRFLGSAEVSRGGCMVETRFGTVDARRETKFDLIKESLQS
jgi:flagellar assembly protein FliH